MRNVNLSIAGLLMSAAILFSSCSKSDMNASVNVKKSVKVTEETASLNNHAPVASTEAGIVPSSTVSTPVTAETETAAVSEKTAAKINRKIEKIEQISAKLKSPQTLKNQEGGHHAKAINEKIKMGLILVLVGILAGILLGIIVPELSIIGGIIVVIGIVFIILGLLEM